MTQVNNGRGLRTGLRAITMIGLVLFGFGVGCETKPSAPIDRDFTKSDPQPQDQETRSTPSRGHGQEVKLRSSMNATNGINRIPR